jgi:hypothetical protein
LGDARGALRDEVATAGLMIATAVEVPGTAVSGKTTLPEF